MFYSYHSYDDLMSGTQDLPALTHSLRLSNPVKPFTIGLGCDSSKLRGGWPSSMAHVLKSHHTLLSMDTDVIMLGFGNTPWRFFPFQPSPAVEFELAHIGHWFAHREDPGDVKVIGAKIIFNSLRVD